jgi:hypothetical protein
LEIIFSDLEIIFSDLEIILWFRNHF